MKITAVRLFMVSLLTLTTAFAGSDSEVTKKDYAKRPADYGIVLVAANWGRWWGCSGFENAELMMISFERIKDANGSPVAPLPVKIDGPPRLLTKRAFINFALLVPAGTYALTGFDVKIAKSVSDIVHAQGDRATLLADNQTNGGTFTVGAGETVYIGNFWLDCAMGPMPWRYYSDRPDNYRIHIDEFRQKYPFLDLNNVQFRLFKTTVFGVDEGVTGGKAPDAPAEPAAPTASPPSQASAQASEAPATPAPEEPAPNAKVNSLFGR